MVFPEIVSDKIVEYRADFISMSAFLVQSALAIGYFPLAEKIKNKAMQQ